MKSLADLPVKMNEEESPAEIEARVAAANTNIIELGKSVAVEGAGAAQPPGARPQRDGEAGRVRGLRRKGDVCRPKGVKQPRSGSHKIRTYLTKNKMSAEERPGTGPARRASIILYGSRFD